MPLSGGETPRWQRNTFYLMVTVLLGLAIFIAVSGVGTNNAVIATKEGVERTDCARRVNAEQSTVRDTATIADRAARRYLDNVLLIQATTGERPTPEQQQARAWSSPRWSLEPKQQTRRWRISPTRLEKWNADAQGDPH